MNDGALDRDTAFRGDVQGMRAVAVVAVIVGHAGVAPGGFIGVDVFFVISGFLITGLLLAEAARTDRISLTGFYARRARRILPAATLVLLVTVVASVLLLSFLDAINVARDAIWSALFAANIHFAREGADYFAQEQATSPLQHFWSLAVEEQFYLVWPLVVGLVVLLARRRGGGRSVPTRGLLVAILLIGAASFAWSVLHTPDSPQSAYFSSLTRAWELAVGAALAVLLHTGRHMRRRWLAEVLGWGGIAAIAVALVTYDEGIAFPGYLAALPVLGAATLIVAGSSPRTSSTTNQLLSLRVPRVIGDWSYSLYLWHWPLLVLPVTRLQRDLTVPETLVAVAATFGLSYLTFRFVETPFRTGRTWRVPRRALILYPASLVLVLSTALSSWAWSEHQGGEHGNDPAITTDAFGEDDSSPEALVDASVRAAQEGWPIPSDLTPDLLDLEDDVADVGECDYTEDGVDTLCRRGDEDADRVIVVTGDSHARQWIPAFEQIAEETGYAAYYLVKPQCTAAFVDPGRVVSGAHWPECGEFHDWVVEQVAELDPDLLVIATSPPPHGIYQDGELVEDLDLVEQGLEVGFEDAFAAYSPHAERIVLLADTPRLPDDPGRCLAAPDAELGDCLFEPADQSTRMRQASITAANRAGVATIIPTSWLCADGLCPVVIGSTIAYRDRGHISTTRAAELAGPLRDALGLR